MLKVALIFGFMPFFSFYPIGTDVQPVFFVLAGIYSLTTPKMWRFTCLELVFFVLAVFSIFYVNDLSDFEARKSLGLLLALVAYHFWIKNNNIINQRLLFFIVLINFVAVLLHYLVPSFFVQVFGRFMRVIKILHMRGPRGASGFAAEPGFMGALSVFYLAVSFYLKEYVGDRRHFYFIVTMCLIIVTLTKSGTGFVLIVIFIVFKYVRFSFKSLIYGTVAISLFYIVVYNFDLGRGGRLAKYLLTNPQYLFLVDTSVGARIFNIYVGLLSVYETPLGNGAKAFQAVSESISMRYGLAGFITFREGVGNISAFAKYSIELGIVFWFFLLFLVVKSILLKGYWSIPYVVVALFYLSASFSIVFPPVWFIFAMLHFQPIQQYRGNVIKQSN